MDYIKTFQENRGINERVTAFSPQLPQKIGGGSDGGPDRGTPVPTGARLLDNGDIVFYVYAPGAKSIEVKVGRGRPPVCLSDSGGGRFEGTLKYDPVFAGPHTIHVNVNGIETLNPYFPVWFAMNRPVNYIEVPDPETAQYISLKKGVPHGTVAHEVFFSETINDFLRCYVYTPPGYEKGGEYPVLYLQHGATENETCWVHNGKAPYILDNLLAEGRAEAFIAVMNDGMVKAPTDTGIDSFDGIEQIITLDCREFIEGKYRVNTDKWSRAIAGLSLGSMQASYIGMRHPELYGYIGVFSGFMRRRDNFNTYELSEHLEAVRNYEKFALDYKLFFRSEGDLDRHFDEFLEDDEFCIKYGIDKIPGYVRRVYPGQGHEWGAWRRALYDFAQHVFKWE